MVSLGEFMLKYQKRHFRKWKERLLIFHEKIVDHTISPVVLPVHILIAFCQKGLVVFLDIFAFRNRNKQVPAVITHFVLY